MNEEILLKAGMLQRLPKNLGTFSTTFMDEKAVELFNAYSAFNAVDIAAYPELGEMTSICEQFILSLFNTNPQHACAFPTSGSSEAIFLSLLILKHQWKTKNPESDLCNIVLSPTAHVSFVKVAAALDIQIRFLKFTGNTSDFDEATILQAIDQNTIAFVCTLGDTITLYIDDVEKANTVLENYFKKTQNFIPIHVDAASGGFVVPFYYPSLVWDFKLKHVKAINVSSHKFGMVYPSLGWVCIDNSYLTQDLYHENTYLGKTLNRLVLQFSHSAAHIAAQSYYINTLGTTGYSKIIHQLYDQMNKLHSGMKSFEKFNFITPNHRPAIPGLIFTLKDEHTFTMRDLPLFLKKKGWHLPTFTLKHLPDEPLGARIVVRNGFTDALLEEFIVDLKAFFISR